MWFNSVPVLTDPDYIIACQEGSDQGGTVPASVARRVVRFALFSAPRDARDRCLVLWGALCAPTAADTAGSATCSHHNHDTFTARSLEMDVNDGVKASATADERRCTVAGSTFFIARKL